MLILLYFLALGEWKENRAHGKGKFFHVDGDTYEGTIFPLPNFTERYSPGQWKDDKTNGQGVYANKDGAKYEGNWKDDSRMVMVSKLGATGLT